jgi:hypothetical protein
MRLKTQTIQTSQPARDWLIQKTICDFIRAGGFAEVAADAAGIPQDVFDGWIKRGTAERLTVRNKRYAGFRDAVQQAQARLAAEIQVHEEAPLAWLRQGPGKQTATCPGWTQPVAAPRVLHTEQQINVLLTAEMQGIVSLLLDVLAPFPDARLAVAKALGGVEVPKLMLPG